MEKIELKGGIEVPVKASSSRWTLSNRDLLLGLLMAALAPVLVQLWDLLMAYLEYKPVHIDWRALTKTGLSAGAAYVLKNWVDKGKIVINKSDYEEAKK